LTLLFDSHFRHLSLIKYYVLDLKYIGFHTAMKLGMGGQKTYVEARARFAVSR
jgi:hypothetical protein